MGPILDNNIVASVRIESPMREGPPREEIW